MVLPIASPSLPMHQHPELLPALLHHVREAPKIIALQLFPELPDIPGAQTLQELLLMVMESLLL
jgi:hypothetical protein